VAIFGCNGVMVLYLGTDVMLMPKPTAMVICWLLRHGDVLCLGVHVMWFGLVSVRRTGGLMERWCSQEEVESRWRRGGH